MCLERSVVRVGRRGGQRPDSDLDLLVDFAPGTGMLRWAELIIEFERLLGCAVEIATEASLRSRVRGRALTEAVPL